MATTSEIRGFIFTTDEFTDIKRNSENISKWGYNLTFVDNFIDTLIEQSEAVAQGKYNLPVLFLVSEKDFLKAWDNDPVRIKHLKRNLTGVILIHSEETNLTEQMHEVLMDELETPIKTRRLKKCLSNAGTRIDLELTKLHLRKELAKKSLQLQDMNSIGISLTLERNLQKLLENILTKARKLTAADAGSIFLVDQENSAKLHFSWAQNDSIDVPFTKFTMPIDKSSIAGFTVLNGEIINIANVYEIPKDFPYKHDSSWDESVGYKTISLLCVPLKKINGEIVGCIQLINRKKDQITTKNMKEFEKNILPFNSENESLLSSLASQAAVALENSFLIENIQNLFDGFIKASVVAIESRDPSTSGHSDRVADLTIKLALAVNNTATGKYADVEFDENQLKEMKFAAILHDFGKVAIKENILLKKNKIFEHRAELLKWRIELYKRIYEISLLYDAIENSLQKVTPINIKEVSIMKLKIQAKQAELENLYEMILEAAKPKAIDKKLIENIADYKKVKLEFSNDDSQALIPEDDFENLSIPHGSLNSKEKKEVESHVEYTYNFLNEIPWTKELSKIPEISGGHHEKLNGQGYPDGKTDTQILVQSKIMAIADIFDALTATDRPYSNGLTIKQAIEILRKEADKNQIDKDLVEIFDAAIQNDEFSENSNSESDTSENQVDADLSGKSANQDKKE